MLKKINTKDVKASKKLDRSIRMYNADKVMNKLEIERNMMLNATVY